MENINKILSTYNYPANGKGERATEVGFYIDSRLDRFGNVLRKINVTDIYGQIFTVPYSGKTLMISVCTGPKTTSIRRAKRSDLENNYPKGYSEAYQSYLNKLSKEERNEHQEKLYNFLDEIPPVKEEVEPVKTNKVAKKEINSIKEEEKNKPE